MAIANKIEYLEVDRLHSKVGSCTKNNMPSRSSHIVALIADVSPVTNRVAYLLGKEIGTTNLTLYDAKGGVIAVVDVTVTPDAMGLKQKLAEVMPTENLGVQVANDRLILSGTAEKVFFGQ